MHQDERHEVEVVLHDGAHRDVVTQDFIQMFEQVNAVEYGLTAAIFTSSLASAHRAASRVESGFVWVNNTGSHFLGTSFGGYKQSGIGREEGADELLSFTQVKNINITL